jgi:DNA repair photolyase
VATVGYVDVSSILTPASGFMSQYKYTLNPYGGCSFGCEYCYARLFAPTATKGKAWGKWVTVKRNACELVALACQSGDLEPGDAVYMSSVTDPYQPVERRVGLTRAILETLLESGIQPRLTVQTRSPLATRDIDRFRQFERIRVNFTISTDSDAVRRRYEPHCPAIETRLKAASAIAAAGVPIGVSISPMLPLDNVEEFGQRLLDLRADEYVTQYLKPARSRFAAGSSTEVLRRVREDGWTMSEYKAARERLADIISG